MNKTEVFFVAPGFGRQKTEVKKCLEQKMGKCKEKKREMSFSFHEKKRSRRADGFYLEEMENDFWWRELRWREGEGGRKRE